MASFFSNFLHGLAEGDTVKDYRHASNLFSHDNFRLAPKYRHLFHCNIILNKSVASAFFDQNEVSFMVKTITLPAASFETNEIRQYNRKAYSYTGITYEPVSITLHDDNSNNVRNFLANVYNYYIDDGNKPIGKRNIRNANGLRDSMQPNQSSGGSWGLDSSFTRSYGLNLIQSIEIYSLTKGKGALYTLHNPVVSSFGHGSHDVADGVSPNESTLVVQYDSFTYDDVSISQVKNFGQGFYDRAPSTLSGGGRGSNSVIGPGGMFDKGMDVFGNLKSGNILGAAVGAFQLREQIRANDARDLLKNELKDMLPSAVQQIGRNVGNSFPTATLRKAQQEVRGAEAQAEVDSGAGGGASSGGPDGFM